MEAIKIRTHLLPSFESVFSSQDVKTKESHKDKKYRFAALPDSLTVVN